MVTLTPSSDVGRLPLTTSSVRQMRPGLVSDRFVPRIVTQEPASMPGWKLAASTTDAITGAAGGTSLATNAEAMEGTDAAIERAGALMRTLGRANEGGDVPGLKGEILRQAQD